MSIVSPAADEVWVAESGDANSLVLEHYDHGTWTRSTMEGATPSDAKLSASGPNDVWLSAGNALYHYGGTDWAKVDVPAGPGGATLYLAAIDDVSGPDVYASFTYLGENGFGVEFGRYNGSEWQLLGAPTTDFTFESIRKIAYVDNTLVVLADLVHGLNQYVFSYSDGNWTAPIETGHYFCCSVNQWAYDWVVNSPTDIWLYGNYSDEDTGSRTWCGHFNGTGLDTSPCVAGGGDTITAAVKLANGRHLVGSDRFTLLQQPGEQTPVPAAGVTSVTDLAVEPGTNVVWAVTQSVDVPTGSILRYGVATDQGKFVVTATATPATLEQGDVATIKGSIDPVPSAAADRVVTLQRKAGTGWVKVATTRASAGGTYDFNVEQSTVGTISYRVKKAATGSTAAGYSATATVKVLQPFAVAISAPATVSVGTSMRVQGTVTPSVPAEERSVELQRKTAAGWVLVLTGTTNAAGGYHFDIIKTKVGTTTYRVEKPAVGGRRLAYSKTVQVSVVS